ncbi:CoA pyrophosphatase [Pseudohongiella sp.]|uniref:Nudix hydrolase domain-containing protein n=1 Tax=marine sediment metagenome TaxID=412755 RepID=A0A0F9W4U2_9ZZZZ|nr:CoA pyrophosphatase [Pseudohongiella sp.]HDZ09418.1 CoA pyrophosphatase [Pseudohongiella sp.]HEA63327.1 CoA pyrophosphatase [Pseudohongiella sp.]
MNDGLIARLESFFRLSPSSAGLILPPDPAEHAYQPDQQIDGRDMRRAGVLIPVIQGGAPGESRIMLTLRTKHLRSHAGQVSLPGGSAEPQDVDIIGTALREAEEETCLPSHAVQVIGTLPALIMPSAFHVTPVVGLVHAEVELKACPIEVAEIFYVPTAFLLNPKNYRIASMEFQNRERRFMETHFDGYRIWGATAAILHHLAKQIHELEDPA